MRLKSAYREKPADNIPSVEIDDQPVQPSASTTIDFDTSKAEPAEATIAAIEPATTTDEATLALQKALADLKASEEYARHIAQQAQRQPSREEKLASWRAQGADESELRFLAQNVELIDRADVTSQAAAAAFHAGFQRGTEEFNNAVKANFDALMGRTEAPAQAQPAVADPAGFFEPPPPSRSPAAPDRASIYSAPVSRTTSPGGYREPSPKSVRLSPAEQQIAAASGISDLEYAKNKLRMLRERAAGERQE